MLQSSSRNVKAFLLAGAILAPAIILATLGFRAYRAEALLLRERFKQAPAAIVRQAAAHLNQVANNAIELAMMDLEQRCHSQDPDADLESGFREQHPLAKHIFVIRGRTLIYPPLSPSDVDRKRDSRMDSFSPLASEPDVDSYVRRLRASRRQANLVTKGLRAEHGGKLLAAQKLFASAISGKSDAAAQSLLALARIARRRGDNDAAREAYQELRRRFGGRQDRQGVSYALLADAGMVELGSTNLILKINQGLLQGDYATSGSSRRFYLWWTADRLSGQSILGADALKKLRRVTRHLFASEQFAALLRRHGITDLVRGASPRITSVALDRRTVIMLQQNGEALFGFSMDEAYLQQILQRDQKKIVPQGRGIQIKLRRVGEVPDLSKKRVLHASLLDPPLSYWMLNAIVPAADPMAQLEPPSGLYRLGLVVGLILVLLVGLMLTYLGVRRESDLARLKSDFASNVSHELKTPLTSIRMYAEMLEQGIATTPQVRERYHQVIIRESERLGRLIANVLDFSQVERGTRGYELRDEDLHEMTREAVETFHRLSEGEQLSISFKPSEEGLPSVTADREAAVQCILNLLSNAAKYSPSGPRIEVILRRHDEELGVEVSDQGMGIQSSELKRIFDDFYRAPGARKAGVEGTGLGLALVRRHMQACGGRVEVQSDVGKGSRFTIWFLVTKQQEQQHV